MQDHLGEENVDACFHVANAVLMISTHFLAEVDEHLPS